MDAGLLHGAWTAALLAVFAAIVAWAWSGRRKRDFEEAARLPLEGEAERLPVEEDPQEMVDRASGAGSTRSLRKSGHPAQEENVTGSRQQGARHG